MAGNSAPPNDFDSQSSNQELAEQEFTENVLAVKAALRDIEAGEHGRPFDEFDRDFRAGNNIPNA